uniref:Uncharacterized protein n=1 Tax=Romanomermis culicivorax TaxID=13658 RepID=A0A915KSE4_ROMCU
MSFENTRVWENGRNLIDRKGTGTVRFLNFRTGIGTGILKIEEPEPKFFKIKTVAPLVTTQTKNISICDQMSSICLIPKRRTCPSPTRSRLCKSTATAPFHMNESPHKVNCSIPENDNDGSEEFKSDPSSLRNIMANRSIKSSQQPEVKPPYRLSMYQTSNVLSETMFNLKDQNHKLLAASSTKKKATTSPKVNPFSGCSTNVRESIYYSKSPSCKLKFSTNTTSYKPMSTIKKFAANRNVPSTSNIFLPNPTNTGLTSIAEMRTSMYSRPGLKLNAVFQAPNMIPEIKVGKEETVERVKFEKRESEHISSTNSNAPIQISSVNETDLFASLNFDDLQKELLFINGVEMLIKKNLLTKTIANSSTVSHFRITPTNKQGTLTKIDEVDSEEKLDNYSIKDTKSETSTRIQEKKAPGKGNFEI